jgi:phage shock protein A
MHAALARASAQMARLSRSGDRLQAELARARHEAEQWRQRACECADDTRAIECLKRAKQRNAQSRELERRLETQQSLVGRLRRDMAGLEARHAELCERHRALRARETRAQAAQLLAETSATAPNVEDVFERWETQVTEQEYLVVPLADEWDDLEQEFETQQERAELLAELHSLRGGA